MLAPPPPPLCCAVLWSVTRGAAASPAPPPPVPVDDAFWVFGGHREGRRLKSVQEEEQVQASRPVHSRGFLGGSNPEPEQSGIGCVAWFDRGEGYVAPVPFLRRGVPGQVAENRAG